jgi:hypothetical protein
MARIFFFNIYDVITSPETGKRSTIQYCRGPSNDHMLSFFVFVFLFDKNVSTFLVLACLEFRHVEALQRTTRSYFGEIKHNEHLVVLVYLVNSESHRN